MSARRPLAFAGLALVLAAATLLPILGAPGPGLAGSARSSEPSGRRALFLLLAELGFEPELWERPPGELPAGATRPSGLLWLSAAPRNFDPAASPGDPLELSRARGARAWSHYREFVDAGGTLVLPADRASADFLTLGLGLAEAGTEPFELDRSSAFEGDLAEPTPRDESTAVLELHGTSGELCAREIPLGAGAVVLAPGGSWLDNAELEDDGHALLAVRLVERCAGSGAPVRFDEWALSDRPREGSALSLAFGAGRFPAWHLVALLALLAWAALGAREFPRDPEPNEALSPLLRVSASAAFLGRHGRFDALAEMLRAGTAERLGGTGSGGAALAELARRRGAADSGAAWTEALVSRKVSDLEGLVALDRDLRSTERRAGAGALARREDQEGVE